MKKKKNWDNERLKFVFLLKRIFLLKKKKEKNYFMYTYLLCTYNERSLKTGSLCQFSHKNSWW